jgi:hypothetical protein
VETSFGDAQGFGLMDSENSTELLDPNMKKVLDKRHPKAIVYQFNRITYKSDEDFS